MIWVDGNSNLEREYCDMKDQLFQVLHEHNAGASNDLISQKGIHGIKLTQNKKKIVIYWCGLEMPPPRVIVIRT